MKKHIRLFFIIKYHSPLASDRDEPKWKIHKIVFIIIRYHSPFASDDDEPRQKEEVFNFILLRITHHSYLITINLNGTKKISFDS